MGNVEHINEVVAPALATYRAEIAGHARDYSDPTATRCLCGFIPSYPARSKPANQSLGMHIHHAWKRADRKYTEAANALLRADYRRGGLR
jgi:hypothetical protein